MRTRGKLSPRRGAAAAAGAGDGGSDGDALLAVVRPRPRAGAAGNSFGAAVSARDRGTATVRARAAGATATVASADPAVLSGFAAASFAAAVAAPMQPPSLPPLMPPAPAPLSTRNGSPRAPVLFAPTSPVTPLPTRALTQVPAPVRTPAPAPVSMSPAVTPPPSPLEWLRVRLPANGKRLQLLSAGATYASPLAPVHPAVPAAAIKSYASQSPFGAARVKLEAAAAAVAASPSDVPFGLWASLPPRLPAPRDPAPALELLEAAANLAALGTTPAWSLASDSGSSSPLHPQLRLNPEGNGNCTGRSPSPTRVFASSPALPSLHGGSSPLRVASPAADHFPRATSEPALAAAVASAAAAATEAARVRTGCLDGADATRRSARVRRPSQRAQSAASELSRRAGADAEDDSDELWSVDDESDGDEEDDDDGLSGSEADDSGGSESDDTGAAGVRERKAHRTGSRPAGEGEGSGSGSGSHECAQCNRRFDRRSNLIRHQRIHDGEKRFVCKRRGCGKRFVEKHHLLSHERSHSGEQPYQCRACGRLFSDRSNLTRHHRQTHKPGASGATAAAGAGAGRQGVKAQRCTVSRPPRAVAQPKVTAPHNRRVRKRPQTNARNSATPSPVPEPLSPRSGAVEAVRIARERAAAGTGTGAGAGGAANSAAFGLFPPPLLSTIPPALLALPSMQRL